MTSGQLGHEGISQASEGVVDRVADMAMVDLHAVGTRYELDHLSGVERAVDGVERSGARRLVRCKRQRDLSQSGTDRMDPSQVPRCCGLFIGVDGARAVGALLVDDAAIDEPCQGGVERRQVIERETIVRVVCVQEVEGVIEVDVVRGTEAGRHKGVGIHVANHNRPVDRLRASRYIYPVTDKTYETGYANGKGSSGKNERP